MSEGMDTLFGDTEAPPTTRRLSHPPVITDAVRERFFSRVVTTDSCWLWTGAISSPDGYGRMAIHHQGRQQSVATHRLALWLAYPDLGTDFVAEHHCNEPLCVRVDPDHVHISTQSENLRYAVACGRAMGPRVTVNSAARVKRSRAVRDLALAGFDRAEYDAIVREFSRQHDEVEQLSLFDL